MIKSYLANFRKWSVSFLFALTLVSQEIAAKRFVSIERKENQRDLHIEDILNLEEVQWRIKTANSTVLAYGYYDDQIEKSGWGKLEIWTPPPRSDFSHVHQDGEKYDDSEENKQKARAAGYLEGYLTQERIYQYWYNYKNTEYKSNNGEPSESLVNFMTEQYNWVNDMVLEHSDTSKLWNSIGQIMTAFDGLYEGYSSVASDDQAMSKIEMYMLNSVGDLEELNGIFSDISSKGDKNSNLKSSKLPPLDTQLTDCSAFIKIISSSMAKADQTQKDKEESIDIVAGHSTWRSYYAMLRIYKIYHFNWWKGSSYPNDSTFKSISMSSSPGLMHSKDDFYVIGAIQNNVKGGLIVMETTNSIYNKELFSEYITSKSLLSWQRAMMANHLSESGREWTTLFAEYNSGTYCNQWMVLDAKKLQGNSLKVVDNSIEKIDPLTVKMEKVKTFQALPKTDLLWIIEQIPGHTHAGDVTDILLLQGYWSSYNIPYFEDIFTLSGYPSQVAEYGDDFTYDKNPRANIFRRDADSVKDLKTLGSLMQYNDYLNDPFSEGLPQWGIAARADLLPSPNVTEGYQQRAFGAVDSKIVSATSILGQIDTDNTLSKIATTPTMLVKAKCGPTTEASYIEPFTWNNKLWENVSHKGLPQTFNFDWVDFTPL